VVKGGGAEKVGQMFVQFVQTEPARKILRKYGFELP
jgi:ABC-type molybdate transport system substrate-binding protein